MFILTITFKKIIETVIMLDQRFSTWLRVGGPCENTKPLLLCLSPGGSTHTQVPTTVLKGHRIPKVENHCVKL